MITDSLATHSNQAYIQFTNYTLQNREQSIIFSQAVAKPRTTADNSHIAKNNMEPARLFELFTNNTIKKILNLCSRT